MALKDPAKAGERAEAARTCCSDLRLTIPALVDDMEDSANIAYAAWPERLYVVGKDGRLAYAGGPGPRRFSPEECGAFLQEFLSDPERCRTP